MLSHHDNERLVRVAAGTPMGELLRRYWQPAALSSELPEPDSAPVRVRLLGENLLAFRDTTGRVGLVDAFCAHRRAPLFFGRNEDCGLRCVYHGWKFDVDGNCVDMPSEPADTPMKAEVKLLAYPAVERGGVVWAYLGPRKEMPALPDYEWTRAPATHRHVSKTFESANFLQALEGGLDTAHSSFLHNNDLSNPKMLRTRDGAPRIDVEVTDCGYTYVSTRKSGEEGNYVRVYHYVMPTQQMRASTMAYSGGRANVPKLDGHIWVPVDDEHTHVFNWALGYDETVKLTPEFIAAWESHAGRAKDDLIPGTFRLKRHRDNDFLVDREAQRTRTFTGIKGLNTQDIALQEGMGPIVDRARETLGTSDRAIITMRRLLLEATRAVERGERPKGVDPATYRGLRPHDTMVPPGADWRQVFANELTAKW
ncbi:MAG TPA: Rieske 2Fe-2S domain-containing protein [Stellaceae bacterium]|nr:Rieske 2Fe-2S domain-containing protein [Stellaceae bacterium]